MKCSYLQAAQGSGTACSGECDICVPSSDSSIRLSPWNLDKTVQLFTNVVLSTAVLQKHRRTKYLEKPLYPKTRYLEKVNTIILIRDKLYTNPMYSQWSLEIHVKYCKKRNFTHGQFDHYFIVIWIQRRFSCNNDSHTSERYKVNLHYDGPHGGVGFHYYRLSVITH